MADKYCMIEDKYDPEWNCIVASRMGNKRCRAASLLTSCLVHIYILPSGITYYNVIKWSFHVSPRHCGCKLPDLAMLIRIIALRKFSLLILFFFSFFLLFFLSLFFFGAAIALRVRNVIRYTRITLYTRSDNQASWPVTLATKVNQTHVVFRVYFIKDMRTIILF